MEFAYSDIIGLRRPEHADAEMLRRDGHGAGFVAGDVEIGLAAERHEPPVGQAGDIVTDLAAGLEPDAGAVFQQHGTDIRTRVGESQVRDGGLGDGMPEKENSRDEGGSGPKDQAEAAQEPALGVGALPLLIHPGGEALGHPLLPREQFLRGQGLVDGEVREVGEEPAVLLRFLEPPEKQLLLQFGRFPPQVPRNDGNDIVFVHDSGYKPIIIQRNGRNYSTEWRKYRIFPRRNGGPSAGDREKREWNEENYSAIVPARSARSCFRAE